MFSNSGKLIVMFDQTISFCECLCLSEANSSFWQDICLIWLLFCNLPFQQIIWHFIVRPVGVANVNNAIEIDSILKCIIACKMNMNISKYQQPEKRKLLRVLLERCEKRYLFVSVVCACDFMNCVWLVHVSSFASHYFLKLTLPVSVE